MCAMLETPRPTLYFSVTPGVVFLQWETWTTIAMVPREAKKCHCWQCCGTCWANLGLMIFNRTGAGDKWFGCHPKGAPHASEDLECTYQRQHGPSDLRAAQEECNRFGKSSKIKNTCCDAAMVFLLAFRLTLTGAPTLHGCGSKPCIPGENDNRYMSVHPPRPSHTRNLGRSLGRVTRKKTKLVAAAWFMSMFLSRSLSQVACGFRRFLWVPSICRVLAFGIVFCWLHMKDSEVDQKNLPNIFHRDPICACEPGWMLPNK